MIKIGKIGNIFEEMIENSKEVVKLYDEYKKTFDNQPDDLMKVFIMKVYTTGFENGKIKMFECIKTDINNGFDIKDTIELIEKEVKNE